MKILISWVLTFCETNYIHRTWFFSLFGMIRGKTMIASAQLLQGNFGALLKTQIK